MSIDEEEYRSPKLGADPQLNEPKRKRKGKGKGFVGYVGHDDCAQSLAEADSVVDAPVGMYVTVKLKSVNALIAPVLPKS